MSKLPPKIRAFKAAVVFRPPASLKPAPRNPRTHSPREKALLRALMTRFGFVAPVQTAGDVIVCGHARVEAAKALGLAEIPTIDVSHLSPTERRALTIAENRVAELAGWDFELLRLEYQELDVPDLDFELELTGFQGAELENILGDGDGAKPDPKADKVPPLAQRPVTRQADIWLMGEHRLVCADARDPTAYKRLMGGEQARMVLSDPPYNVKIVGNVAGKGKAQRREFVMASGEMSPSAFTSFLTESLGRMAEVCLDGAIAFVFIDWRHLAEMLVASHAVFGAPKNLIVWVKTNGGMGSFYRSQHELIFVLKKGDAPHVNTFGLGDTGRFRTNVWTYPGVNTFRRGRDEELALHPTAKSVALLADAIRDVSHRGEIVLDAFAGSGGVAIAAEKTKRRARLIELDPLYCDVICRRWAAFAKTSAVLAETGRSFDEVAAERGAATGEGGDE